MFMGRFLENEKSLKRPIDPLIGKGGNGIREVGSRSRNLDPGRE